METGPDRESPPAPPTRAGGVVVAVAAVLAYLGGVGAVSSRAAPGQLAAFELEHERVVSVVGSSDGLARLAKRRVERRPGYGPYVSFDDVAEVSMSVRVADQRRRSFTIDTFGVGPSPPDTDPSKNDALAAGKSARGKLKYRRKRTSGGYGNYVEEQFAWTSRTRLARGTRVVLKGALALGRVGGGTYDAYDEFQFDGASKQIGGVTAALADGNRSLFLRGLRMPSTGGTLAADVTWDDETSGTVVFSDPPFLDGKSGRIRFKNGVWTVTGPAGHGVRVLIREDGSGVVNVGLGRFPVAAGDVVLDFE